MPYDYDTIDDGNTKVRLNRKNGRGYIMTEKNFMLVELSKIDRANNVLEFKPCGNTHSFAQVKEWMES